MQLLKLNKALFKNIRLYGGWLYWKFFKDFDKMQKMQVKRLPRFMFLALNQLQAVSNKLNAANPVKNLKVLEDIIVGLRGCL